uniref:YLPM1-like spectrin repeat domain-containing protein n=1 Tax=Timema cristinae TaxID=61476 RepID=A0A7R9CV45_TIMCR|nr:unnamed protein product [Timema cristinae]
MYSETAVSVMNSNELNLAGSFAFSFPNNGQVIPKSLDVTSFTSPATTRRNSWDQFLTKRVLGATPNPHWHLEGTKSWNQWGAPGAYTTPSYQAAPAAPPGAAAATYPMTYPYYGANPGIPATPSKWGWRTFFVGGGGELSVPRRLWHYQESMSAMGLPMGAGIPPMPPVDMGNPPPLPPADKPPAPPPPPEEGELAKEPPLQDLYRPPVQSGASYGVPPPAIAKPQDDFNKPPPGGYEKPGYRAQEGYQATKRSFDGDTYGRTADPHYPGPEDTKKLRPGGWEENRGGARGGRWGGGDATTPAPAPAPEKPASEPPSTAGRDNPEELSEAEKAFDIQFKQWEDQFNSWKDQNINHPDKSQYREYEAKWESWREQLLQRREQMRKKREQSNASKAAGEAEGSQSDRSSSSSRGRSGRRGRGAGAAGYTDLKPQPYTGLKPQPAAPEDYSRSPQLILRTLARQKLVMKFKEGGNRLAYGSGYERYPAGQEDPNSRVGGYVEPGLPQPDPNPPFDGAPTKAPESFEEKSKKDESSNSADQASKDPDLKPESTPGSNKAERPLPEQSATPVNVSVEAESKTDETGGNFLKTSSGDGIPGLDLLAEKAGVADKKDQELSVGFDVDDRAKVVEPGSDQPPAGSFTLPPPNISGTGQGTLNLPGMNQVPPNLPEMNQAPQNMQGYGSMYNNAPLNMQGYGSGGKQNIPGFGPPSKQGPPPNMQGYGPGGPYNQGYGQDGNQGPRHMPMDHSLALEEIRDNNLVLEEIRDHNLALEEIRDHSSVLLEEIRDNNSVLEEIRDHISALEEIRDSSSALEEIRDHSLALEEIRDNNSVLEEIRDHSSALEEIRDSSLALEEIRDHSLALEEIRDHSLALEEIRDNNLVLEEIRDNNLVLEEIRDHSSALLEEIRDHITKDLDPSHFLAWTFLVQKTKDLVLRIQILGMGLVIKEEILVLMKI